MNKPTEQKTVKELAKERTQRMIAVIQKQRSIAAENGYLFLMESYWLTSEEGLADLQDKLDSGSFMSAQAISGLYTLALGMKPALTPVMMAFETASIMARDFDITQEKILRAIKAELGGYGG